MIRTVIIDDEKNVRELIRNILSDLCPGVEVVGEADGVNSGLKLIKDSHPDLLLLDIKMEDGTGFDLMAQYKGEPVRIVFITAYEEYAIRAIKLSAVDYILKPIAPQDLKNAIEKTEHLLAAEHEMKVKTLLGNLNNHLHDDKKIVLRTHDKLHYIPVGDIIYGESDSSYSTFYLKDKTAIIVSRTLKEFEDILAGYGFYRPHKSYLINLKHIRAYDKTEGGNIIMAEQSVIPISDKKKEEFLNLMENL
jgi:two-component system, LytTR family, response regulator